MEKGMVILPLVAGVLWGSVGIFVRKLYAAHMDNVTILSSRVLVASILMLIGLLMYDRSLLKVRLRDIWLFLATGVLGMLGLNLCYNEAINQLTLSLAAVLLSLAPVFVMALAAVFFKEKVTAKKLFSVFLAFLGCLLVSNLLERAGEMKWSTPGVIIGTSAAFFYALYTVFSKVAMGKGYTVFTITFYSMLTVSLALIPFTDWHTIGTFIGKAPVASSAFMIMHSLFTSVLPYVLFTLALIHVETGKAAILTAGGEPTAAMLFGIVFFSEVPTILSFIGLIITVIALSFICTPDKDKN